MSGNILIVDDSATVRQMVKRTLAMSGLDVDEIYEAGNGIEALARSADVLVVGCGVAELVGAEWVKPGAVVVDVGVNRVPGPNGKMRTVGDVKFSAVSEVAGWISPVPGGVGPVTVAMLLRTVVEVAERLVS